MYCSNCGKKLADGLKVCNRCGSQVISSNLDPVDSKRKTIFDGIIHKCPNCGSHLDAFEHKCKECGYELRGSNTSNVIKEFAEKLGKTMLFSSKHELISNFYVPNTKEDIYEFFILAISNMTTDYQCEEAWKAKLEQTYHKAKLSFGTTPEFDYIDKLYAVTMKKYQTRLLERKMKIGYKYAIGALLLIIGIVMAIFGIFMAEKSGNDDSPFYAIAMIGIILSIVSPLFFIKIKHKRS